MIHHLARNYLDSSSVRHGATCATQFNASNGPPEWRFWSGRSSVSEFLRRDAGNALGHVTQTS